MMKYTYLDSPIGSLLLTGQKKLEAIRFPKSKRWREPQKDWKEDVGFFKDAVSQLTAYFQGDRLDFDLEMDLKGTEFQKKVWKELAKVPYGTTISYGELAKRIGNPKASRAVGMANGKNPIPIIIPCHRVIGKDGSLTGFGGGLDVKQTLLNLEKL
ncbi:MAG: methylated-DNA--[protein]-cysteine S-methyltransferase [Pseudomonadota bacterium]